MGRRHVFLNAPTARELNAASQTEERTWHVVDCGGPSSESSQSANHASGPKSVPPEAFEAASRRIAMLYENMIFRETPSEEEEYLEDDVAAADSRDVGQGEYTIIRRAA